MVASLVAVPIGKIVTTGVEGLDGGTAGLFA